MRLHHRQGVLTKKQPCAAAVGMKEREDGHLNVAAPTSNHQWNLASVELAFPARIVLTSDIQIRILDGLRPHGGADAAHMVAHARIAQGNIEWMPLHVH